MQPVLLSVNQLHKKAVKMTQLDIGRPPMRRRTDFDFHSLVDTKNGQIDRRIFWDQDIYALELERIFARAWIFVGHESQIAKPGDFLTTFIGQDGVIVARARDKSVHVFLNSCTHRGNKVCFAETGNSRQFTCNFHGWSFGLDGSLLGAHEEDVYEGNESFDKSKLGLHKARVQTYHGLIFATFDPEAPTLEDFLGDYRFYLDVILDNDAGGTEFIDGCIKSRLKCNWKFPAENFIGDAYHAGWTHVSAAMVLFGQNVELRKDKSYHANAQGHGTEFGLDLYGNAMTLDEPEIVEYLKENEAKFAERLGKLRARMVGSMSSATVFPNMSYLCGHNAWRSWVPKGPHEIELHTWIIVNKDVPESLKQKYRVGIMKTFSPSGILEMDDGENWEYCTQSNQGVVTRRQKLHYGMGLDSDIDHPELQGNVHLNQINDANQRAFYHRWAEFMSAESWSDISVGGK